MNHSPEVVERFSYIKEGCKIVSEDLPEHLKYSRTGKLIKSFSKVLFRLDRNQPSHTLVPGHSAFPIHPWLLKVGLCQWLGFVSRSGSYP